MHLKIDMITAITLTGDRPLAFALCQNWVIHQTVKPDQWIVVDDGRVPLKPTGTMSYIRREPRPNDPKYTMGLNLAAALPLVKGDKIVILEDDEYYAPIYVEEMSRLLVQHEVVGIKGARYYHLPSGGYMVMGGGWHASLAETALRSSYLPELNALFENGNFPIILDIVMWRRLRAGNPGRSFLFPDSDKLLYCGIKGLPGRAGIGVGHRSSTYHLIDTPDRATLRQWVPKDYQVYLDILSGKLTANNYEEYFERHDHN
jgi:hypothetical protein